MQSTPMSKVLNPLCHPPENEPGVDPPAYPVLARMGEEAEMMQWSSHEINFSNDADDFKKFTPQQQHTITTVVSFFREAESAVLENLISRLLNQIKLHEARKYYGHQVGCEQTHENTYIRCFQSLVTDKELRRAILHRTRTLPCIANKNAWARKHALDPNTSLEKLLLVFACVEGMFFATSFAIIFYIRKHHPGKLVGLITANDLINRDEYHHFKWAIALLMTVVPSELRPSPEVTYEVVKEACEIEQQFAEEALKNGGFPGLRTRDMKEYAMATADFIMTQLNLPPIYKIQNPLTFMDMIAMECKGAFFETSISDYAKMDMSKREGMWEDNDDEIF
jgi:ribonucleoside-diphosphate reductase subunit M2